ncbi:MAG: DUF885 domain-containing protein [Rheinheimera sp.]|nr:DUF885 domain-containing protein [Rheinheimera sp.]
MRTTKQFRTYATLLAMQLLLSGWAIAAADATAQLQQIIDDHWQYSLQEDPVMAGRMGKAGYNNRLPGVTAADRARRLAAEQQFLQRLQQLETAQLKDSDRVNHQLLSWVLRNSVAANQLYLERIPANTFYSFWGSALDASSGLTMKDMSDYRDYISRINDFKRYFAENMQNMRVGMKDGFVLPKIVVQGIAPTVRAQVYQDPTQSSLYQPFNTLPASLSAAEQQQLRVAAKQAIAEVAIPAFAALADFLEGEYLQAASQSLAAEQLPNGKAYYRHSIQTYVTADIAPGEIHNMGLAEVKRIRAEMDALIKASGFVGSFAEFTRFLRTDPQFYAKTPEDLLKEAAYIAKRIDYRLPEFFGKLPRMPYGIVPVPAEIAANYTTASYNAAAIGGSRGGAYWLNTQALDQRPFYTNWWRLTLHEAASRPSSGKVPCLRSLKTCRNFGATCTSVPGEQKAGVYTQSGLALKWASMNNA